MERLRFLHIPKTAGSTFNSILKRQYHGIDTFRFTGNVPEDRKRFEELSAAEREQIALFIGHAPITSGIQEADTATLITFLRDPVSRVKSFCQFVSEGRSPYLRKSFPPDSFDLDRFMSSGNRTRELSNLQTKMLINSDNNASSVLIDSMSATVARDTALDNLFHKVTCFGLQEYFNESLIYFASVLAWKKPLYYFSRNIKGRGRQIKFEDRHLQQIEELNAIDIEVYAQARQHFLSMLNSPEFDNDKLWRLRSMNSLAVPFLRVAERIKGRFRRIGNKNSR